jgi:phage gpG-like protein
MGIIDIKFEFPDLLRKVQEKENEINLLIAATLQTNRGLMFDDANASRTPWLPPKLRDGAPLSQKGPLRQSFAPRNDGITPAKHPDGIVKMGDGVVTIGTTLAYAPILNDGGIIRPKKGKWLWIPLPDGKANSSNAPTKEAKTLRKAVGRKSKKNNGWKWVKTEGGAIVVRAPSGKVFLLARKGTIPARPMTEWSPDDQQELEETLRNKIAEILNG